MSSTYVQPGKVVTWTNGTGSGVSAGDVVVMGDCVGVALVDIANGEDGSVSIQEVHTLAKVSGTAWSQGDKLDWDSANSAFTKGLTAGTGDVATCAVAAADAGSSATTGQVLLTPGTGAAG